MYVFFFIVLFLWQIDTYLLTFPCLLAYFCFPYAAFREATVQSALKVTFSLKILFTNSILEISVIYWQLLSAFDYILLNPWSDQLLLTCIWDSNPTLLFFQCSILGIRDNSQEQSNQPTCISKLSLQLWSRDQAK